MSSWWMEVVWAFVEKKGWLETGREKASSLNIHARPAELKPAEWTRLELAGARQCVSSIWGQCILYAPRRRRRWSIH
jgi:hypothetical protein